MKLLSASALCSFLSVQAMNADVKEAIAKMNPFALSLKEVFILGRLLRKGEEDMTMSRLSSAFANINPTKYELTAFYNLQQQLLKDATNMDEAKWAMVGLSKDTVVDTDFFSDDSQMAVLRSDEMVRAHLEQEVEKKLVNGPGGSLKSGSTELERPVQKSKGLEFFLDIRNMGFDQQWKIAEWFKLHPTARLTRR